MVMASATGTVRWVAAMPASTSTRSISSVAYATEESASEEKTASATRFESRSWRAWASGIGRPTTQRFSRLAFMAAGSGAAGGESGGSALLFVVLGRGLGLRLVRTLLELANRLPERASQLGDLGTAEEDEADQQYDDQLLGSETKHGVCSSEYDASTRATAATVCQPTPPAATVSNTLSQGFLGAEALRLLGWPQPAAAFNSGDFKEMPMNILVPDIAVAEKILRSVVVYGFLLVAFRIAGKRQLGQMTPFDLIVLLIISNVLQNAAIGADNSLGGGLLGAAVIIFLNYLIGWLTFRHRP